MKTAMKRLLSFMLVAMMLVSIVPMAASADNVTPSVEVWTYKQGATPEFELAGTLSADEVTIAADDDGKVTYSAAAEAIATAVAANSDISAKVADMRVVKTGSYDSTGTQLADGTVLGADSKLYVTYNPVEPAPVTYNTYYKIATQEMKGDKVVSPDTPAEGTFLGTKATYQESDVFSKITANDENNTYELVSYTVDGSPIDFPYTPTGNEKTIVITVKHWAEYSLTLWDEKSSDYPTKAYDVLWTTKHVMNDTPKGEPDHNGFTFKEWNEVSEAQEGWGYTFIEKFRGKTMTENDELFARYNKASDTNPDKKSTLTVVAKRYVDGVEKNEKEVIEVYNLDKGENVYNFLFGEINHINNLVNDLDWGTNTAWVDRKFYENDNGSDEITNLETMDGDRTVYVMVGEGVPVKVQLYMHLSYKKEPEYIINLYGYDENDVLKASDINKALKNKWSDRKYNWTGMYSNVGWNDILGDKENVTALSSFSIERYMEGDENRTVNVHIHAVRTSSNNSDNPKTGDAILMAVTILGLSATALAAVYFFNKKKNAV